MTPQEAFEVSAPGALVGVIMGSKSDWPTMKHAAETLDRFGVPYEVRVVSAHRTPNLMAEYAASAADRGLRCLIAGAGGAAHLPGMSAAHSTIPVLGVPIRTKHLDGRDSFLSIAQMPDGVPVGTLEVGPRGAVNAACMAARIVALGSPELAERLAEVGSTLSGSGDEVSAAE